MPPSRPKLAKVNEAAARNAAKEQAPSLWEGPNGAGPNGGVTNGLLARYLTCPARFRVWAVEGLRAGEHFNPTIEFGNMWHEMERAHADSEGDEVAALTVYADKMARLYPTDRPEIALWADKAAGLFTYYVNYWNTEAPRQPLFQEQVFSVPYRLPSGRTVRLRGKWDGAHVADGGVWLDEHKTKSSIDAQKLARHLTFDLQTMLYYVSYLEWARLKTPADWVKFREEAKVPSGVLIGGQMQGVRYNVVRRPLHKSVDSMVEKVELDLRNNRAGEWFTRFEVRVLPADVARFRRECLDPVCENACDDWEWMDLCRREGQDPFTYSVRQDLFPHHWRRDFRMPYGIYNPLTEGGAGDVDEYLNTSSRAGLHRTEVLFPELVQE